MSFWVIPFISMWVAAPVIVVDPGHGGTESGAQAGAFLEKEFALALSLLLKADLEREGFEVHLTREADVVVSLQERIRRANEKSPAAFISVHANAMPPKYRQKSHGIETYFLSAQASTEHARQMALLENRALEAQPSGADILEEILFDLRRTHSHTASSRLAHAVQEALVGATGARDRGVQQAYFLVLVGVNAPAILVEFGFVSHEAERKKLKNVEYQHLLSKAVTEGVRKFLISH